MVERARQKKYNILKINVLLTIVALMISGFWVDHCTASGTFSRKERLKLIQLFAHTKYDQRSIRSVFFDPRLKKMPVIVNRNVKNKEIKQNYDGFLKPYSINLANRFARKWRTMLAKASQKFGVDREVLVAVLLVETGFGNVLGRYPIVSVYSSIITENYKQQHCMLSRLKGCLNEKSRRRLHKKAAWAEKELRALVEIAEKSGKSLFQLKGSYAGAFGIPQFLPSSFLKWGYDSDKNGSVNLFLFPDAIYSTANYLKAHGWQKGLHTSSNRNVIWEYNHSRIYVDTIFKVAQKVRVHPPNIASARSKPKQSQVTLNLKKQKADNRS